MFSLTWVQAQTFNNTYVLTNPASASVYDYHHMLLSVKTDDGYIKAMYLSENIPNPDPAYFEVSISITKVNQSGNIMWSRKIGKAAYDVWPAAIIPGHNTGESIIVGNKDPKAGSLTTAGNAIAIKIDNASGNIIWENEFNTGFFNTAEVAQGVPGTNTYVLAGKWQDNNSAVRLQAIGFDDAGTMMWSQQYETANPGEGTPTSICYRPAQDVVKIMGLVANHQGTYTIGLDHTTGSVSEPYRYFTYGGDIMETAGFIQPTSDDGYIMTLHTSQQISPGVYGPPNAVLVKVDNTPLENITWSKRYEDVPWALAVYEDANTTGQYDVAVEVVNGRSLPVPALLTVNSVGTATQLIMYDNYEGTKTNCMIRGFQSGYLINASYLSFPLNQSGFQLVSTDITDAAPCMDPIITGTANTPCSQDPQTTVDFQQGKDLDPDLSNVDMEFQSHDCNGGANKRTLGLSSEKIKSPELYPNPVHNSIQISQLETGPVKIEIIDVFGKTVQSEIKNSTGSIQSDLSNLKPGHYLIRVNQENGTTSKRIMKY